MQKLEEVLRSKDAQRALVFLYSQSQLEHTRNGKCGMEIGMAREKDQGAVLKFFLKDSIVLDIDNNLPEDYLIENEKVSAKHCTNVVGTSVKVKWTSASVSVSETIETLINAPDEYYPHLLITYIDVKNKKVTIVCVSAEHNKTVIKTLGHNAFKVQNGNIRGIEYSKQAMKMLLQNKQFSIEIDNADLKGGEDPIERRLNILKTIL
jgi:hypothetical protein